jgi:hypothetical protein
MNDGTGVRRPRAIGTRGAAVAAFLLMTGAVAAGCGSKSDGDNSVASLSSSSAPSAGSGSGSGDLAAYSKCMRQNGLPNFPDPATDGTLALPSGTDPNSKEFKNADAKCGSYKPAGTPQQGGNPQLGSWSQTAKLKYAKCMRDNGITGFSDPDGSGNFSYRKGDGPDPNSAQYKAAEEACKRYKGTVPEGGTQGGAGQ